MLYYDFSGTPAFRPGEDDYNIKTVDSDGNEHRCYELVKFLNEAVRVSKDEFDKMTGVDKYNAKALHRLAG